jgi:inhibitor of KinA
LNETALLISFENRIDEAINRRVMSIHGLLAQTSFEGFIESVPAYASVAIFYDPVIVKKNCNGKNTAFDWVKEFVERIINDAMNVSSEVRREKIIIPVCYNGEDLERLAMEHQLSTEEVIQIHTGRVYRVFMIGFLPGFAYMGTIDDRIATPRHRTPRTHVQAGSVGIAGFQTGIYPMSSPGGWQLIGRTPIKIFDPAKEQPCLLKAGDAIQFTAINENEFEQLNEY